MLQKSYFDTKSQVGMIKSVTTHRAKLLMLFILIQRLTPLWPDAMGPYIPSPYISSRNHQQTLLPLSNEATSAAFKVSLDCAAQLQFRNCT